jgi:NADH-quinone oxidoreductase subunit N
LIETLQAITPEIILIVLASAMYLAGTFAAAPCRCWFWAALGTLAVSGLSLAVCATRATPESSVVVVDSLATFARALALVTGVALVLLSERMSLDETAPEYFASLLLVVAGSMLVAGANELVLLFLGLELISIPTYVLLYLPKHDAAAQESAAKYFFLSVFSSALFLYGLSLIYGAAGSTHIGAITQSAAGAASKVPPILLVALALTMAGLGFKVAAVPFHFYAPDVYQGTTNTLAALLAWVPKAAGFFAMLRLVNLGLPFLAQKTAWLLFFLAAFTMTVGNVLGLLQNNLRRLFAYSSIAHAGYMLVGIGVGAAGGTRFFMTSGSASVVFYLVAYAAMTLGAFAVIVYLSSSERPVETVDDLAGLARTNPGLALAMAVFLFSLTGIPITAGFWGKFAIFSSAVASGHDRYVLLAVIGMVNAAISSYYYLRIIGVMYMQESFTPIKPGGSRSSLAVVAGCAVITLLMGFVPSPFLTWARGAGSPTQRAATEAMAIAPRAEANSTTDSSSISTGPLHADAASRP